MRNATLCLLTAAALVGCMYQNMSPATKLRDSVEAGNEGARWGRMDIASERVAPEYMREYAKRHYDWGNGIQMADLEILNLEMAEDEDTAIVTVRFAWYAYDTMSLERTIIRQKWRTTGSGYFVLAEETVIDGDERLLEPLPEPEEDDVEDEESADATDDVEGEELAADQDDADDDEQESDDDDGWIDSDGEESSEPGTLARAG